MSPEPFETNIARLVRQSALPLDEARRRRSREDFLRAAPGGSVERQGRRLAIAAAALLVCGVLLWAVRHERAVESARTVAKERPAPQPPTELRGSGGDERLKGSLTLTTAGWMVPHFVFTGRSTLPDRVALRIRAALLEEKWDAGRIVSFQRDSRPGSEALKDGRFEFAWPSSGPGVVRLGISAPDDAQDIDVLKTLTVKEGERAWTFEYLGWDDALLPLLGPQLAEIGDLVREARDIIARAEAACASEEQFVAQREKLTRETGLLQSRADAFAAKSVYPASLRQIVYAMRDLATSIPDFKWAEGKFQGPVSYYTDNKKKRTFRQDPFEFAALRRYLDEAEVIAGREFGLWIVKDRRRAGLQDAHRALVREQSKRPGVSEFLERLVAAEGDGRLEEDLRTLAK